MLNFMFTFWKNHKTVFQAAALFYILIGNVLGFHFSTDLPTLIFFFQKILNYGHPSGCEVVSHGGFDLHFLND